MTSADDPPLFELNLPRGRHVVRYPSPAKAPMQVERSSAPSPWAAASKDPPLPAVPRRPEPMLLGRSIPGGEPVYLGTERPHLTVLGETGEGKSTLFEHLILDDLRHRRAVVVLDPHELLVQRVVALADEDVLPNLVLLEKWEDRPFRLNPLEPLRQGGSITDDDIDALKLTFEKIFHEEEFAPALARDVALAAAILGPTGGSMADVPRVLRDRSFREARLARLPQREQARLRELWRDRDSIVKGSAVTEAPFNRVVEFLARPTLGAMVSWPETTIRFDELLTPEPGVAPKSLLLSLSAADEQSGQRLGTLFLTLLARRIFARGHLTSERHYPEVYLYVDEYQNFATKTVDRLLEQGRKFGVHVRRAQQRCEQNGAHAVEGPSGDVIVLRLRGSDAAHVTRDSLLIPLPDEHAEAGISHEPLQRLRRGLHHNARVRELFRMHLLPLIERFELLGETDVTTRMTLERTVGRNAGWQWLDRINTQVTRIRTTEPDPVKRQRQALVQLRHHLERLLIEVMEGKLELGSEALALAIGQLVWEWRTLIEETPSSRSQLFVLACLLGEFVPSLSHKDAELLAQPYAESTPEFLDYLSLCLGGTRTTVSLQTALGAGLTNQAVRAEQLEVSQTQQREAREQFERERATWQERHHEGRIRWFYIGASWSKIRVECCDIWKQNNFNLRKHFEQYNGCTLCDRERAASRLKELQDSGMSDIREFVDELGETAVVWLDVYERALRYAQELDWRPLVDESGLNAPSLNGVPLAVVLERQMLLARHLWVREPLRGIWSGARQEALDRAAKVGKMSDRYFRPSLPRLDGYRVGRPPCVEESWHLPWTPGEVPPAAQVRIKLALLDCIRNSQQSFTKRQANLTARIVFQKAALSVWHRGLAEQFVPNDIIDVGNPKIEQTVAIVRQCMLDAELERRAGNEQQLPAQFRVFRDEQMRKRLALPLTDEELTRARRIAIRKLVGCATESEARAALRDPLTFAQGLFELCALLRDEPLRVATGMDTRVRSASELRARLIEEIKGLDRQIAYYRSGSTQQKIALLPPLQVPAQRAGRMAERRAVCKRAYGVSIDATPRADLLDMGHAGHLPRQESDAARSSVIRRRSPKRNT